jgi:ABC-type branched-subunit amino acid transport system ATPase component/sugar phosphate permease
VTDVEAVESAGAVARRRLLPTSRQLEVEGEDPRDATLGVPGRVAEPAPPRRSLRSIVGQWLRDADPRGIEGPALPLVVFGMSAIVTGWDDIALSVLLPEIRAEFGFNLQFLVTLATALSSVSLLMALPMGYLADRIKRVWLVRIGSIGTNLASLVQGFAPGVGQLVSGRILAGVSDATSGPAIYPLLTDYYPSHTRARVFAFFSAAGVIGGLIGGPIAGELGDRFGWRVAVISLGIIATIVSLMAFLLKEPPRGVMDRLELGASEDTAAKEQAPVSWGEGFRAAWSVNTLRKVAFATPLLYMGGQGVNLLLSLYYAEVFQLGARERGWLTTAQGIAALLGLVIAGPVGDRFLQYRPGRLLTVLAAFALVQCAAIAVLAVSPSLALSIGMTLPFAFIGATIAPAQLTLISMVVPARLRGFGLQMLAPFTLIGIFLFARLADTLGSIGLRDGILFFIPFLALGSLIIGSASTGVDRDIRAARAAALADEEARKARDAGRSKMLVCRDVDVTYDGVQVLFGVDFDVEEGDIIALLGTNGAGKSTLLRAIAGISQASNGAIFLDGRDITHAPPHENAANGVVMMPGGHAVFPTLTVRENLQAAAWMYREDERYVSERTARVLEFFPRLRERLDQQAGNLSGGEQQQVALGQAFLMRPRLLMIDELSLGLAPAVVEQLLDILREIHAQGTTVVLVEQSLNVALTIAQRAVFMEKGEIRFSGSVEELLRTPALVRSVFMGGAVSGGGGMAARRRQRPGAERVLPPPALSVREVSVAFGGVQALRDVSLDVRPGEIVGIIGPNGAGKTTLFDVISGFVEPATGQVTVDGTDVLGLSADQRSHLGLSRSFQNARLFPSLTVRDAIAVAFERTAERSAAMSALWLPKVRKSELRVFRRVDALIGILGLGAYANKFVGELSTGSRRAVDIACIMAADPKILLLDEPSSGLAQAETEELGPVMQRIVHDTGCGILAIEHDMPLITSVADRLVAMELGAVIAEGTPDVVCNDPRVLSSYLSASESVISRSDGRMATIASALGVGDELP